MKWFSEIHQKTFRLNSITLLGLVLAWPAASFAQLKMEVLETVKIHESHIYGYYPRSRCFRPAN